MLTAGEPLASLIFDLGVTAAALIVVLVILLSFVASQRARDPVYRELAEAHEQRALKLAERLDRCTSTMEDQQKLLAAQEQTIHELMAQVRQLEGLTDIASVHMIADANREQLQTIEQHLSRLARWASKEPSE